MSGNLAWDRGQKPLLKKLLQKKEHVVTLCTLGPLNPSIQFNYNKENLIMAKKIMSLVSSDSIQPRSYRSGDSVDPARAYKATRPNGNLEGDIIDRAMGETLYALQLINDGHTGLPLHVNSLSTVAAGINSSLGLTTTTPWMAISILDRAITEYGISRDCTILSLMGSVGTKKGDCLPETKAWNLRIIDICEKQGLCYSIFYQRALYYQIMFDFQDFCERIELVSGSNVASVFDRSEQNDIIRKFVKLEENCSLLGRPHQKWAKLAYDIVLMRFNMWNQAGRRFENYKTATADEKSQALEKAIQKTVGRRVGSVLAAKIESSQEAVDEVQSHDELFTTLVFLVESESPRFLNIFEAYFNMATKMEKDGDPGTALEFMKMMLKGIRSKKTKSDPRSLPYRLKTELACFRLILSLPAAKGLKVKEHLRSTVDVFVEGNPALVFGLAADKLENPLSYISLCKAWSKDKSNRLLVNVMALRIEFLSQIVLYFGTKLGESRIAPGNLKRPKLMSMDTGSIKVKLSVAVPTEYLEFDHLVRAFVRFSSSVKALGQAPFIAIIQLADSLHKQGAYPQIVVQLMVYLLKASTLSDSMVSQALHLLQAGGKRLLESPQRFGLSAKEAAAYRSMIYKTFTTWSDRVERRPQPTGETDPPDRLEVDTHALALDFLPEKKVDQAVAVRRLVRFAEKESTRIKLFFDSISWDLMLHQLDPRNVSRKQGIFDDAVFKQFQLIILKIKEYDIVAAREHDSKSDKEHRSRGYKKYESIGYKELESKGTTFWLGFLSGNRESVFADLVARYKDPEQASPEEFESVALNALHFALCVERGRESVFGNLRVEVSAEQITALVDRVDRFAQHRPPLQFLKASGVSSMTDWFYRGKNTDIGLILNRLEFAISQMPENNEDDEIWIYSCLNYLPIFRYIKDHINDLTNVEAFYNPRARESRDFPPLPYAPFKPRIVFVLAHFLKEIGSDVARSIRTAQGASVIDTIRYLTLMAGYNLLIQLISFSKERQLPVIELLELAVQYGKQLLQTHVLAAAEIRKSLGMVLGDRQSELAMFFAKSCIDFDVELWDMLKARSDAQQRAGTRESKHASKKMREIEARLDESQMALTIQAILSLQWSIILPSWHRHLSHPSVARAFRDASSIFDASSRSAQKCVFPTMRDFDIAAPMRVPHLDRPGTIKRGERRQYVLRPALPITTTRVPVANAVRSSPAAIDHQDTDSDEPGYVTVEDVMAQVRELNEAEGLYLSIGTTTPLEAAMKRQGLDGKKEMPTFDFLDDPDLDSDTEK